jgi:integrase
MERYLKYLESDTKSSRDAKYKIDAFILARFGKKEVASLTSAELQDWLRDLAKTPARIRTARAGKKAKPQQYRKLKSDDHDGQRRRKSTANRVLTLLKAGLNKAFNDGTLKSDLAWRRVKPFKAVDAARQEFLSVAEAKRVINASEPDFRMLVQAALLTGCRYGELCRLRVRDFDPANETLAIHSSKSGKARHVMLTQEGVAFFRQLVAGRERSDVMLKRNGKTPWQTSQQIRPMREVCERAKIDPPVGFHALRHSWASLAVMGGLPLLIVADNLGHSTTRMVERHYGHLTKDYQKEQIAKFAPKFGIKSKSNVVGLADAEK